jgi:RNA polymerase sigma factor (sigma-70 family)
MLRAIRELDRYEPARSHNSIFGWLTGLARNEIRRSLAREQPLHQFQSFWNKVDIELASVFADLETETINDEVLQRHETSQMVNATMAQLPPHYQEALQAKYVHGLSVREVALLLQASEKAAESVLSRARTAFRSTFLALARNWNVEFSPDG